MSEKFTNVYNSEGLADAYSRLAFPGTYYLAYRDLPAIIKKYARGKRALDFGCGAGRSTRFLHGMGFDAEVVDISENMLERARERDPGGTYRLVPDGDLSGLPTDTYDLVLSVFTFDNIPTMEKKVALFRSLKTLLKDGGCVVSLVSSSDIYINEWASFSTKDFPENKTAKSGDTVKIIILDVADRRPVEDILWTHEDYQEVYHKAGLTPIHCHRPLARTDEPFAWVSEATIAPWTIYVLTDSERPVLP